MVSPAEAAEDIAAIWATEPALLVGCEATGKGRLPAAGPGNVKVRDQSTTGRADLFAYIRNPDGPFRWAWTDCRRSYPRLLHPDLGPHPPNAILRFPYRGTQILVGHKPPAWPGADPARDEYDNHLARIMDPDRNRDRSRILLWDSNGVLGARSLADRIRGRVVGDHIDGAVVVRRVRVLESGYRRMVKGHRLHTDHPHGAFFIRWTDA